MRVTLLTIVAGLLLPVHLHAKVQRMLLQPGRVTLNESENRVIVGARCFDKNLEMPTKGHVFTGISHDSVQVKRSAPGKVSESARLEDVNGKDGWVRLVSPNDNYNSISIERVPDEFGIQYRYEFDINYGAVARSSDQMDPSLHKDILASLKVAEPVVYLASQLPFEIAKACSFIRLDSNHQKLLWRFLAGRKRIENEIERFNEMVVDYKHFIDSPDAMIRIEIALGRLLDSSEIAALEKFGFNVMAQPLQLDERAVLIETQGNRIRFHKGDGSVQDWNPNEPLSRQIAGLFPVITPRCRDHKEFFDALQDTVRVFVEVPRSKVIPRAHHPNKAMELVVIAPSSPQEAHSMFKEKHRGWNAFNKLSDQRIVHIVSSPDELREVRSSLLNLGKGVRLVYHNDNGTAIFPNGERVHWTYLESLRDDEITCKNVSRRKATDHRSNEGEIVTSDELTWQLIACAIESLPADVRKNPSPISFSMEFAKAYKRCEDKLKFRAGVPAAVVIGVGYSLWRIAKTPDDSETAQMPSKQQVITNGQGDDDER